MPWAGLSGAPNLLSVLGDEPGLASRFLHPSSRREMIYTTDTVAVSPEGSGALPFSRGMKPMRRYPTAPGSHRHTATTPHSPQAWVTLAIVTTCSSLGTKCDQEQPMYGQISALADLGQIDWGYDTH